MTIGDSPPRPDALAKVTGAALYPADLVRPGMLHLQVVFARRPHARIRAIDPDRALAHPGVVAVLTAADVPHNAYGLVRPDQPVLCGEVVRYWGDRVALVVAETRAAARAGAALVAVDYEDLPAVTEAPRALEPGAPLVHADRDSNLLYHARIRRGDAARALAEAEVVLAGEFETGWQEHAFLQPEAGVAQVDEAGRVVVETAGQWLHEDRRQIAAVLGLPEEQVVVRYAAIGGAFGGREDLSLQHLLALAAWRLRRPVAMVWSREESILAHHKRHPVRIRCRWGARRDGTIVAVETEALADGGAYASTSEEVIKVVALLATGAYEVANVASDARVVYTNNLPCGAFRGFGAPQAQFAAESMVNRLAQMLAIDPVELRRRNLYREGSIEPTQRPVPTGVGALAVLERCAAEARARLGQRRPAAPYLRRGVGIACGIKNVGYSFGFPEQATCTLELHPPASGGGGVARAVVRLGAADVGQGAHLAMRQIAAEALAMPLETIELVADDSSLAPNAGSASASRLTTVGGRAVVEACRAALAGWAAGQRPAVATVKYEPEATTALDPETTAGRPNFSYGYAAQAVEVEVDTRTGQVQVLDVISVHDVGRVINRQMLEGQIEGCVAQALGYALLEHFQSRDGRVTTPSLSTYLLPTALDVPTRIAPIFLETPDGIGPFGARGVAEMPMVPLAPAVAAAIQAATGVWLAQQPMTPERVLAALQARVPAGV
ncbi:MAG TPA: xanthine dehydrogenase family protein molybdopterin-binding subunit [Chloroflexota bacterium]|jgi:CO/xanthine dehydrogenase Mo-binding subunit